MPFNFNWTNRTDGQDYVLADDVNSLAAGISDLGQLSNAQQDALNVLDSGKIDKTAIVNDLTTGGTENVLSAEQGVVLQASKADQPYQLHTQTDGGWHVEDSAGGLVADCVIGGNGWQSRQGKNLFPGVIKGKTINSATGTISDSSTGAICNPIPINISLSYRLSGIPVSLRNFVAAYDVNHEYIGRTGGGIFAERNAGVTDFTNIIEGKSIENAKYFRISFYTTSEVEGSNINAVDGAPMQLELGLVTTPYEPYTPDPTPEAPIMPVCLPQGTKIQIVEQNILSYPYSDTTRTLYGMTYTDNGDGTITANGTTTAESIFNIKAASLNFKIRPGTYTINGCAAGGSSSTYRVEVLRYIGTTIVGGGYGDYGSGRTFTISAEDSDTYNYRIIIATKPGITLNNLVFKPQIVVGTENLPWKPYTNPTTLITPCDLWATPDGLYKDSWNPLTGNVPADCDICTFTGAERWVYSPDQKVFYFYVSDGFPNYRESSIYCSHYLGKTPAPANTQAYNKGNLTCCVRSGTTDRFYIRDDTYTDTASFKAYLAAQYAAGTPVKVWFAKAESTTVQYPPQPITLPKGIVNVIVELPEGGGVLPSEMSMLYRQDLKAYIESTVNGLVDTFAAHITGLTAQVAELKTAGGDKYDIS